MPQQNQIAVRIPETELEEIRSAIGVLERRLMPHLANLTPQDRKELPRMGDRTVAFVQKAFEYGARNRSLAPDWLDFEALDIDVKAVSTLREISQVLSPILDALDDSIALSGSEAYQGALLFYGNVKAAAKNKVPNAGSIYDDLSARFPGPAGGKKKA